MERRSLLAPRQSAIDEGIIAARAALEEGIVEVIEASARDARYRERERIRRWLRAKGYLHAAEHLPGDDP